MQQAQSGQVCARSTATATAAATSPTTGHRPPPLSARAQRPDPGGLTLAGSANRGAGSASAASFHRLDRFGSRNSHQSAAPASAKPPRRRSPACMGCVDPITDVDLHAPPPLAATRSGWIEHSHGFDGLVDARHRRGIDASAADEVAKLLSRHVGEAHDLEISHQ